MDVTHLIRKYAQVSRTLSKEETEQCQKLTEVGKTLLRLQATGYLEENPMSTNLIQYSADCTPLRTRKHYTIVGPTGSSRASVKETTEYFVQQVFITSVCGQQAPVDRLILREPMPLTSGKTMAALASCMQKFLQGSWCTGTTGGITIHHQVHDRGMSRTFRDAVAGHFSQLVATDSALGDETATHEALHIYTEVSCCLHDSHNAFRWGMQALYGDKLEAILGDLYAVIKDYRASVGKCMSCISSWLDEVLTPMPAEALPSEGELNVLYAAVGVPADLLEPLSSDMRLMWQASEQKLWVLDSFLKRHDAVEFLTNTLMGIWKFPAFCANRWVTVGTSCRTLVQGLLTGYGGLFCWMKLRGVLTDFDVQGSLRMSKEVIEACTVAGLSAYVSESFTSLAMADPRLLRQLDAIENTIVEELCYLESLQPSVWTHLSSLCTSRAWVLRHHVLTASLASAAHLQKKIFWELSLLPWAILRNGSPELVLAEIEALQDTSPDPVICKLQTLCRLKFCKASLLAAISLLQCVSFSSHFTERQHASTATLKRVHDYSHSTLCPRAFVHVLRSVGTQPPFNPPTPAQNSRPPYPPWKTSPAMSAKGARTSV